jgi:hypothetical protein
MENQTKQESMITLPMEKFKHLQITKDSIEQLKGLVELLNKRKKLILADEENLTPYEFNERKISLVKTDIELAKVHSTIIQKEMYFKDFVDKATSVLKEIDKRWVEIMEKAEKKSAKDEPLSKLLQEGKGKDFESNLEEKIAFYINVKNAVYPKGEPTLSKV